MSDFEVLTIAPADIVAGDRILLGEKASNQPVADRNAVSRQVGAHTFVTILCDDGKTQLNMNGGFPVQVRRNKRLHG